MPYNGSGSFSPDSSYFPAVAGALIESAKYNGTVNDIATGLSNAITRDGQATITANIPLSGFKITGAADGLASSDYATLGQAQSLSPLLLSAVSGADTITATATPAPASYIAGRVYSFIAVGTNTGAATLNLNGLGAKAVTVKGSTALVAGNIVSGMMASVQYDGTRFQLLNPSGLLLSGGTVAGATVFSSAATFASTVDMTAASLSGTIPLVFEGSSADAFETSLSITNPTADRTLTIPDASIDLTIAQAASQAAMQTGTAVDRTVTPLNIRYSPGVAKAWVAFLGAGAVSIYGSYNVASVTYNGIGNYNVNFTAPLGTSNYAMIGNAEDDNANKFCVVSRWSTDAKTASACQIRVFNETGTQVDSSYVAVTFFGTF